MPEQIVAATPVLPAADLDASLAWWTSICGATLSFRHGNYAGVQWNEVSLHLSEISGPLARTVGDQTMLRLKVNNIHDFLSDYQQRGGKLHPNGALQTKPWGSIEFAAIDPCGVCVTFFQ